MKRIIATATAIVASIVVGVTIAAEAFGGTEEIAWKSCGDKPGAECATVTVPIDRENPDAGTIDLNVTRRAATDPGQRVGTLFYNPGGPGTGAADLVRDYADQKFSDRLRARFDIIGIDPRGVAGSQQVGCDKPVHDPRISQFPGSDAEYQRLSEHNRAVAESCDPLIRHMGTDSVAQDFDAVRAALGEDKISYFGQSYGSLIGTEYASRYPERVRALSIDGVMDHGMSSDQLVHDASGAVEKSFQGFVEWCRADTACTLHDRDPAAAWDSLVEKAAAEPIPVKEGRAVTAEELRYSAYAMLNMMPEMGEGLSKAITEAENGDATDFATIRQEALENPSTSAAYRSVLCMDVDPQINDYKALAARAERAAEASPHLRGTSEFWSMTAGCVGWPIPPTNPQSNVDIDDIPPSLLVGNTKDPATPLSWAQELSHGIAGSRVLGVESAGHTAYGRDKCATAAIDAYLVDGAMPDDDEMCGSG